jgi:glucose/arabinose dehydrogenase/PKD repeat protein
MTQDVIESPTPNTIAGRSVVRGLAHVALSFALIVAAATVRTGFATEEGLQALPPNFVDELYPAISGIPTGLAMTPDGRLLVTTQQGRLYVNQNGAWTAQPALDLATAPRLVCDQFERGLESVAVDPAFASNNYIYVFYTWAGPDNSCTSNTREQHRVVRYTLSNNLATAPQIILQNIDSPNGNHNGGMVQFGADGKLYVSTGDGGGTPERSRSKRNLNGKILRINADGSIPNDNPFYNDAGALACGGVVFNGASEQNGVCREIFAYGLRNPFKFSFRQGTNEFYINDVGQSTWEEISLGAAGADYGWNVREGFCVANSTTNCGAPPAGMSNPLFAYSHANGYCSINGGAFAGPEWPAPYGGAYYFGDWCKSDIYRLAPNGNAYSRSLFHTSSQSGGLLALLYDVPTRAMYYTQGGGRVGRIRYTAANNRPPVALATVDRTSGPLPMTAQFNASDSNDPDGDALSYGWDFGDGSPVSAEQNPQHTYTSYGVFTATLVVTDTKGAASTPVALQLTPGNSVPTVVLTPTLPGPYRVGDVVTLTMSANDAQDGIVPESEMTLSVRLHHLSQANPQSNHTHPYAARAGSSVITFTMPPPEDLDAAPGSFLLVSGTAMDTLGASGEMTFTVQPLRIPVTLASQPDRLRLQANERVITTTASITGWHGMSLTLGAPSAVSGTQWLRHELWLNTTVTNTATTRVDVPAQPITYTAVYTTFSALRTVLPFLRR